MRTSSGVFFRPLRPSSHAYTAAGSTISSASPWITSHGQSGGDRVAILGDLNAYGQETPVAWLRQAGWEDAFEGHPDAYSYRYDGELGRLDHALLSPALAGRLRGAAHWHANADEPRAAGYRNPDSAGTPWRSSDHDPLLLGLDLAP